MPILNKVNFADKQDSSYSLVVPLPENEIIKADNINEIKNVINQHSDVIEHNITDLISKILTLTNKQREIEDALNEAKSKIAILEQKQYRSKTVVQKHSLYDWKNSYSRFRFAQGFGDNDRLIVKLRYENKQDFSFVYTKDYFVGRNAIWINFPNIGDFASQFNFKITSNDNFNTLYLQSYTKDIYSQLEVFVIWEKFS